MFNRGKASRGYRNYKRKPIGNYEEKFRQRQREENLKRIREQIQRQKGIYYVKAKTEQD